MADDRDKGKVLKKDDDKAEVEAHKVLHSKVTNSQQEDAEDDGPDVEAHKVQHKVQHKVEH
jgi:hypothetical protein